jgi:hypothetical protein
VSNTNPAEDRRDHTHDVEAMDEKTGYSIEGDTPPGEGLAVGPTYHDMDVDHRGEGTRNRLWLVLVLVLVAIFVILAIIGRFDGFF